MQEIVIEERENYVLVVVSGRYDSESSDKLNQVLSDLIDAGHSDLVLDLQSVEYLSSTSLRIVVDNFRKLRNVEGNLWLGNTSPRIEEIFELTGLDQTIPKYPVDQL